MTSLAHETDKHPPQALVTDVELAKAPADTHQLGYASDVQRIWALARYLGQPLGIDIVNVPSNGLTSEQLRREVIRGRLNQISEIAGSSLEGASDEVIDSALETSTNSLFCREHSEFIKNAPMCSVIICTRENPNGLRRCLESLTKQDHPRFAVWVIDNASSSRDTQDVVNSFQPRLNINYVIESRPGLSRARNTALRQKLDGEFVAWLDDDEVADQMWLSELMRAFHGRPRILAASGSVVPAELDTPAQVWFEQFGGHSKGRGFTPQEFSPATWADQHPLYPLPPFGVGANMAFRTDALRRIGSFDEALGAGTPAKGSEDTKMISDLMRSGGCVAYWPYALTRHFHRRSLEELRLQMRGYGSGLTAFYTASIMQRPSTITTLVRLAPRALHDLLSSDSLRVSTLEDDFPRELLAENRRGMLAGPLLYLKGRILERRA
jgi:glycosyltransferase involved in cell wall biosynthesis